MSPQPGIIRRLHLEIAGWSQWRRPLRVAFLSDLHTGSHSDDVVRLNAIVHDVAALAPDLVLYGGDYVNMQPFGGGRVPPRTIAAILSRLEAPLGRFAILGNHDYVYGARAVIDALVFPQKSWCWRRRANTGHNSQGRSAFRLLNLIQEIAASLQTNEN